MVCIDADTRQLADTPVPLVITSQSWGGGGGIFYSTAAKGCFSITSVQNTWNAILRVPGIFLEQPGEPRAGQGRKMK